MNLSIENSEAKKDRRSETARKELVADNLSFPTSIAFDEAGVPYVGESGLPWDGAPKGGRVLRILGNGRSEELVKDLRSPLNGLCWHEGAFILSEGGFPGRISRLSLRGERSTILDNLPGMGNYHTNMVAPGPDGKLYFSQGALTNLGVVGLDAYQLGWLGHLPHNSDLPGYPIVLTGKNFETADPLANKEGSHALTGSFSAFGQASSVGQKMAASLPCTASVMRCNPDGSDLELVCWGIRNAYGLGFLPDGRLIATDQGSDDRGSRPIGNVPDMLFEVKQNAWYGWPDFIGGLPVTDPRFKPTRGPELEFILKNHETLPPPEKPLLKFPVNAAAVKFDLVPEGIPHFSGQLIVALFGDEKPMTAPPGPRVGRNLARIDPEDWSLHPLPDLQLDRPIDVRFNPVDGMLYVLDFGRFEMREKGLNAKRKSGKLWKINPLDFFPVE